MSYPSPASDQYGMPNQPPVGDPGTLDLPYYGIGFIDAMKRAVAKYARFDGRASRSEYWWWVLGVSVVEFVLVTIAVVLAVATSGPTSVGLASWVFFSLAWLVALMVIMPTIAISVRRLHDVNLSGLLYLLVLTSIGGIVIFVLTLLPSNPEGARYDRVRPRA